VVKEIKDLVARRAVRVELVPKAKEMTPRSAPLLNGIELLSEAQ